MKQLIHFSISLLFPLLLLAPLKLKAADLQNPLSLSLGFSSNLYEKTQESKGTNIQIGYNLNDQILLGLGVHLLSSSHSDSITDPAGIVGNKISKCEDNSCDINPDFSALFLVDAVSNLYLGYTPLSSETLFGFSLPLQVTGILGGGLSVVHEVEYSNPVSATEYSTEDSENMLKPHLMLGTNVAIGLIEKLQLKLQLEHYIYQDGFDFDKDGRSENHFPSRWLAQINLATNF